MTEGAAALVGDKGYDSDAFIQRSLKKPLSLSFRRAVIKLTQEIAISSFIKSVIWLNVSSTKLNITEEYLHAMKK